MNLLRGGFELEIRGAAAIHRGCVGLTTTCRERLELGTDERGDLGDATVGIECEQLENFEMLGLAGVSQVGAADGDLAVRVRETQPAGMRRRQRSARQECSRRLESAVP